MLKHGKQNLNIRVAVAACNRPEYTRRSLSAIFGMVGFEDSSIINMSIDRLFDGSINDKVVEVARFFGIEPFISDKKLYCNGNIFNALSDAWSNEEAEFVIMVEDDIIVSPDAFKYMKWAAENFIDDHNIKSVGLWNHRDGWSPSEPIANNATKIMLQEYFSVWGWGTWRDRWEQIRSEWTTGDDSPATSWDVVICNNMKSKKELVPAISRSYNCGEKLGTHRGRAWPKSLINSYLDPDGDIEYWLER